MGAAGKRGVMPRFRKKPVEVDAVLYRGTVTAEIEEFLGGQEARGGVWEYKRDGIAFNGLAIETLEGRMRVSPGDWIIRGTRGELYPCKPGPFADTFEPV